MTQSTRPDTTSGSAGRMFAVGVRGGIAVVYDPASGLTHCPTRTLPLGPVRLDGREAAAWPIVELTDAVATTPLSASWSPALPGEQPCSFCPEDESVTELSQAERVRLADVLAASGVIGVDICDRPGLSPSQLESLARRASAGGQCVISVTTTGEQLEERAESLVGYVDAIRVSVHDPGSSRLRRPTPEGIDNATPGVRAAVAVGLPVQIEALLQGSEASQPQAIVDLAASLGAQGVTFVQVPQTGQGADIADWEQTRDEDAHALVEALSVPAGLAARLRTPATARSHIVVRADGRVSRSSDGGERVVTLHPLTQATDLVVHREGEGT